MENRYDTKTQTKINGAKSSGIEYRVVVNGEYTVDSTKNRRLTIVVTKEGRFVRTFYG